MEMGPVIPGASGDRRAHRSAGLSPTDGETSTRTSDSTSLENRRALGLIADEALLKFRERLNETGNEKDIYSPESIQDARKARLAKVKQRIASGFYDRPEVRKALAERLADRLAEPETRTSDHEE